MKTFFAIAVIAAGLFIYGCIHSQPGHYANYKAIIQPTGGTIATRFNAPAGYTREKLAAGSFGSYLRNLPLKPDGAPVLLYDGSEKPNDHVYEAVVNMEISNKNLQQCADAVMRLRAEYQFATGQKDKIHFNFTNGFRADYSKWRDGYRITVKGNDASWYKATTADTTYKCFRAYLDLVFNYAGSLSLSRELKPITYGDMQPGDVLIYGGTPGHTVIVLDMAVNKAGKKCFMIAQSYMPAQETQVLCNNNDPGMSPWYELNASDQILITPEYKFDPIALKRFGE